MKEFYFTYGCDHWAHGGWTVVEADSDEEAIEAFCVYHPRKRESDCVPCGGIYDSETFKQTTMWRNGNFGKREVERITLTRTVTDNVDTEEP